MPNRVKELRASVGLVFLLMYIMGLLIIIIQSNCIGMDCCHKLHMPRIDLHVSMHVLIDLTCLEYELVFWTPHFFYFWTTHFSISTIHFGWTLTLKLYCVVCYCLVNGARRHLITSMHYHAQLKEVSYKYFRQLDMIYTDSHDRYIYNIFI